MVMKVIVGLGNPGVRFRHTRHNIGYRCVDHFAHLHGLAIAERRAKVSLSVSAVGGVSLVLAKPRTFMNESGIAASYLVRRFRILPSDLVVVYDDLDLPVGKIRIRAGGTAGGHRGLNSVIKELGTQDIPRIRVGIGRPSGQEDEVSYVLRNPEIEECSIIKETVERVSEAVSCVISYGLDTAMNRFN